jgi:hypothetical protein
MFAARRDDCFGQLMRHRLAEPRQNAFTVWNMGSRERLDVVVAAAARRARLLPDPDQVFSPRKILRGSRLSKNAHLLKQAFSGHSLNRCTLCSDPLAKLISAAFAEITANDTNQPIRLYRAVCLHRVASRSRS